MIIAILSECGKMSLLTFTWGYEGVYRTSFPPTLFYWGKKKLLEKIKR